MKAIFRNLYKKRNKETGETYVVFVYVLVGTEEEEQEYIEFMERNGLPAHKTDPMEFYKDDSISGIPCSWGEHPLMFDTVWHGRLADVTLNINNKIEIL